MNFFFFLSLLVSSLEMDFCLSMGLRLNRSPLVLPYLFVPTGWNLSIRVVLGI
jgi:hypothetical protein